MHHHDRTHTSAISQAVHDCEQDHLHNHGHYHDDDHGNVSAPPLREQDYDGSRAEQAWGESSCGVVTHELPASLSVSLCGDDSSLWRTDWRTHWPAWNHAHQPKRV